MEENRTDLNYVLNDTPAPEPQDHNPAPELSGQGAIQAEPPAAKQQEPDHVPRAALQDERRKRQELEHRIAEYERQQQQRQQPAQQAATQPQASALKPAQFETYEQYLEAVAEAKAEEKAAKVFESRMRQMSEARRAAEVEMQTADDLSDMLKAGREKYPDFDQVVADPRVPISDTMMTTMMAIDGGHEVGYHLGKNPAEAVRISRLPPSSQAREIGRLAKQLSAPAPAPAAAPNLPKTLTQTRSVDGRFSGSNQWTGPTPLNSILKGK